MSGERPPDPGDAERDAWLREALRHAPDAQLGPPPALSERILREAQAKARSATMPSRAPVFVPLRWWTWLARPAVGAAFASVMVATAVGLLWWDRPLEDPAPRGSAPLPAPEASVAAPPPTAGDTVTSVADASPPAPPPTPAQPEAALKREATRRPAPPPAREVAPAPERRAAAIAPPPVDAFSKATRSADAVSPAALPTPPAPAPAAPPAPAPTTATAGQSATAESSRPLAAAKSSDLRRREAPAAGGPALAELRASLAVDATRWSWQRGNGPARAVDDRVAAWLADLDAATQGRWQAGTAANLAAAPAEAAPVSDELVLLQDGRVAHRWRIEDGTTRWLSGRERWQAPLDAARAHALRQQLDDATR